MNITEIALYRRDLENIAAATPWEPLVGSRIAVTGASGLLGSQIIDFLMYLNETRNAEISIKILGRNIDWMKQRFANESGISDIEFVKYELFSAFPALDVDYIIHCAGNSHPKSFSEDPVGTLMGNVISVDNILKYSIQKPTTVLIISSGEIYGNNTGNEPMISESFTGDIDLSNARSCYPEGKRAVEALCQAYIAQYGVNVKIARPCRIFGPTMTPNDNKASAQFIRNGLMGNDITLKSDGQQLFSYIYSTDAVSALLYILIKGKNGDSYNVSNSLCDVRLKELATKIAQMTDVDVRYDLSGEPGGSLVKNALLDNTKLRNLGWNEQYDLETSIAATLQILSSLYR